MTDIIQLGIIHLTDLHYGEKHKFNFSEDEKEDEIEQLKSNHLCESLIDDLKQFEFNFPTILAISGDLTEKGDDFEYLKAEKLIQEIAASDVLGSSFSKENVFIVPGNHDVLYEEVSTPRRRAAWVNFMTRLYGLDRDLFNPYAYQNVFDRSEDLGVIIVTLDSCINTEKGTLYEDKGSFDFKLITQTQKGLKKIPKAKLDSSIKIAIVHHHPILIPPLIEENKGFDSIEDADQMLTLLRNMGFHILFHGHKHTPYIYTNDAISAFSSEHDFPTVMIAGGSAGSNDIPTDYRNHCNTYNITTIRLDQIRNQHRVKVITRGLDVYDNRRKQIKLPYWKWKTISRFDETYSKKQNELKFSGRDMKLDANVKRGLSTRMINRLKSTRGNFPKAIIKPSINIDFRFEAVLWIQHSDISHLNVDHEPPLRVIWYSEDGRLLKEITYIDDQKFSVKYQFNDPTIISSKMIFKKGKEFVEFLMLDPNQSY